MKRLPRFLSYAWLPVLLVPLFFVVHAWQRYFFYLKPVTALRVLGNYLLFAAVVFLVLRLVLRSWRTAAFTSVLLLSVFFLWGYIHSNLLRLFAPSFFVKVSVLTAGALLLTALLTWAFIKRKEEEQKRWLSFISLLFLVYTLVDGGMMVQKMFRDNSATLRKSFAPEALQTKQQPDVVFILFDEFPSTLSLQENLHFDNRDIDSFLLQQGFSIQAHSHSNYNFTPFSLASMLNGKYLDFIKDPQSLNEMDYNTALLRIQKSEVVSRFEATGYRFVNLSIFDMSNTPTLLTLNMFPEKARLLTANTYYDKNLKVYVRMWEGPDTTRIWGLEGYSTVLNYNNRVKRDFLKEIATKSDHPRFIYLHVVMPHDPFYYDADGNVLDMPTARKVTRLARTEYYINNLKVARKWLRELVTATQQHTGGKSIIMLMGDHGHKKNVESKDIRQQFANLNAVYFPDRDYSALYDSMTNINVMQVVMNKIFVRQQALLPDSTIHVREGN